MKKTFLLSIVFVFCFSIFGWSQNITVSGNITDGRNGEDLLGATVVVSELTNVGATANIYGFYSLTIPAGEYTLLYRYTGYEQKALSLNLTKDTLINVEMFVSSEVQELEEVQVTSRRSNSNITSSQMEITRLDPKSIQTMPVLVGE